MTKKINTLLVPIDFTECSVNALETAITIAKKNKAEIVALHVIDTSASKMEELDFSIEENIALHSLEKNCQQLLYQLKESIQKNYGFEIEVLSKRGFIGATIVKTAVERDSVMIVLGTHGTGSKTSFLGSNAYSVVKQASCSVLAIPRVKKHSVFTKILFPDLVLTSEKSDFLKTIAQKRDMIIEIPGLVKNSAGMNLPKLNTQVLFLENKLLEANIKSPEELQQTLHDLNEIYPLKMKFVNVLDHDGKVLSEPLKTERSGDSRIPVLSISGN